LLSYAWKYLLRRKAVGGAPTTISARMASGAAGSRHSSNAWPMCAVLAGTAHPVRTTSRRATGAIDGVTHIDRLTASAKDLAACLCSPQSAAIPSLLRSLAADHRPELYVPGGGLTPCRPFRSSDRVPCTPPRSADRFVARRRPAASVSLA